MSWTDKIAIEQILKLKEEFNIGVVITTGAFIGADTEFYAQHFRHVYTMDIEAKYLDIAQQRLSQYKNISYHLMPSWEFIKLYRWQYERLQSIDTIYFYLDAHFYDPQLASEDKWVAVKELKALKGFRNCIIVIHDFDNGKFGHLVYDGEHFGWNVISEYISKVNPDFYYYTNEICDIYNEETIRQLGLTMDKYLLDSIRYTNSSDTKRYRGILYAVPKELDLSQYKLVKYENRHN